MSGLDPGARLDDCHSKEAGGELSLLSHSSRDGRK